MTEHAQSKSRSAAIGCGISFQPEIFERLEAEANQMERPNRSLVVERALKQYFRVLDDARERKGEPMVILNEGIA